MNLPHLCPGELPEGGGLPVTAVRQKLGDQQPQGLDRALSFVLAQAPSIDTAPADLNIPGPLLLLQLELSQAFQASQPPPPMGGHKHWAGEVMVDGWLLKGTQAKRGNIKMFDINRCMFFSILFTSRIPNKTIGESSF